MTELVGGGYERLQMQLMVANDQLKEKDKEIERLQGENKHYRQLWHHLCDAIDIFKSEFGRGGLNP